jgi:hypothetical protein
MALRSTQPLTELAEKPSSVGKALSARMADILTVIYEQIV